MFPFRELTRSEVEWLTLDSEKALKRVKELAAQRAAPPARLNVKQRWESNEQLMNEHQFLSHVGVATAVKLTVHGALKGDEWCGIFLGEMMPFLARNEPELMANEHFKRRISEIRSAQKPRKKGRTLRTEIEEIIREARHVRDTAKYQSLLPHARKDIKDLERREKSLQKEGYKVSSKYLDDLRERQSRLEAAANAKGLQRLPELSSSSADKLFNRLVWPKLKRKADELRDNPLIGGLKKANKSGKFQLSDLKMQALQTVKRLASLPEAYYFG